MDNKNINQSIFIIVIAVVLVIATSTFAWLSWRSQNIAMALTVGDIRGLSVTLQPYQINASLSPVSSYTSSTNVVTVNVTADNKRNEAEVFKLYYKIDEIDSALVDEGFKYTIAKCTSNCSNDNNYSVLNDAGGDFSTASANSNLDIYQESVPANQAYNYKVYLWIDSSSGNQSNMQNKTFSGELRANASLSPYSVMRENAVMDNIKSNYVSSNGGINFGAVSSNTNGKGIYIRSGTENDPYPIYYYRGAVDNNNVLFAEKCWKIVRTTSTGGTKLIYNGLPTGANSDKCENATGVDTQLEITSSFSTNNKSLANFGYMYGARYETTDIVMTGISDTYMYGTGYDETNHKLITTNAMNFAGTSWGTYYNQLNNNHYTCFNTSGECQQVNYIFYTTNLRAYYVTIPSGKTINGMIAEMLSNSSNNNSSTIKEVIDAWYASNDSNMTDYTLYLEDTPYCNDRTIYALNGWDPNGGDTTKFMVMSPTARKDITHTISLTCNTNDAFTLPGNALGNGKLTYPVGLLTSDEMILAGNTTNYLYTNQLYWSMSPHDYSERGSTEYCLYNTSGSVGNGYAYIALGIRPVVSLKHGTKFSGGSGIATDPYIVD